MMNSTSPAFRVSILLLTLSCALACSNAPPPVDPEYAASIEEWRRGRLERLTADDGWLTLTGLFWLEPGEHLFGSGKDNSVVLPDASIPETAGRLVVGPDGGVTAFSENGAQVEVNGEPLTEAILRTDADGAPDVVTAGRIRFYILDRDGRLAARVKDPQATSRTEFAGIDHFPINESLKIEARLEPYDSPREVLVPTELGTETTYLAPGVLHFTINGEEQSLEPFLSGPENERYFVIFRDATSAMTTYGAGRFLYTDAAGEDGTTILDFNLAYSPPCAFTPYATCPLPPPQNWLRASIEAGEKFGGEAR